MSSLIAQNVCPNCRGMLIKITNQENEHLRTDSECLECGFYTYTVSGYIGLNDLNERRIEEDREELTELPIQKYKGLL